jgi:hypothetical protein
MRLPIIHRATALTFGGWHTRTSNNIARLFAVLAMLSCVLISTAQQRNRYWYFGGNYGIRFDSLGPVQISPLLSYYGFGYAAISDPLGDLQLVVTFDSIYNGALSGIQSGSDLGLTNTIGFLPLIFPRPGNPAAYDILFPKLITLWANYPVCRHVGIDMSMNGGQGGVIPGNTFNFADSLADYFAGTVNSNGQDYWFLDHRYNSDAFQAYPITSAGLDTVPVISHAGSVHSNPIGLSNSHNSAGEMVFSNLGDRIALATGNSWGYEQGDTLPAITELFNFDQSTGQIGVL